MASMNRDGGGGAAVKVKTDAERDLERYAEIISKYNCAVKGDLKSGCRGRGVFATEKIQEGEMAMEIPIEYCLFHKLNPTELGISTSGPDVTEEDKKRLAWASELKLTAELMQLLQTAAYEGNGFWAEYWWLLPAPDTKELPSNFPRGLLEQLSEIDPPLAKVVLAHHSRLREAWTKQDASSGGGGGAPPVLYWANSMVLSRCFHLWDRLPDGSNNFKGGMCPFIDLINHDFDPNCRLVEKDGKICAMARRDISAGEELTHPYTASASNVALFTRFGFVAPHNAADRLLLPESIRTLPRARVEELLAALKEREGREWEERVMASIAGEKQGEGEEGGRAVRAAEEEEEEEEEGEMEDEIMVLVLEVRKQLALCSQPIPDALLQCSGMQDFVAEKKALLSDCLSLCEAVARELGVELPKHHTEAEDDDGLVPLNGGGEGGGMADADWAASLVRGPPEAPPDIYSMLAPRTEEELAAYASDEEEGREPLVTIAEEAATVEGSAVSFG